MNIRTIDDIFKQSKMSKQRSSRQFVQDKLGKRYSDVSYILEYSRIF